MKKILGHIILTCIIVLSACFICLGCSSDRGGGNKDESKTDAETHAPYIEASGYKTKFDLGEEFSAGDIIVTLVKDGNKTVIQSGEYEIDSNAYNKAVSGDYKIIVYYRKYDVKTEYTVKVNRDEENDSVWGKDLWL